MHSGCAHHTCRQNNKHRTWCSAALSHPTFRCASSSALVSIWDSMGRSSILKAVISPLILQQTTTVLFQGLAMDSGHTEGEDEALCKHASPAAPWFQHATLPTELPLICGEKVLLASGCRSPNKCSRSPAVHHQAASKPARSWTRLPGAAGRELIQDAPQKLCLRFISIFMRLLMLCCNRLIDLSHLSPPNILNRLSSSDRKKRVLPGSPWRPLRPRSCTTETALDFFATK